MSVFKTIGLFFRSLIDRERLESEIDEEMAFHIDMESESNIRKGMSPSEARRQAMIAFGGKTQSMEVCRDVFGSRVLTEMIGDVRYGARFLLSRKMFAFSVLTTLGLCIGVNSVFFSALDHFALRPLPYANPDALVEIYRVDGQSGETKLGANAALALEYSIEADAFESIGFYKSKWVTIESSGVLSRTRELMVSEGFFDTLQLKPEFGALIDAHSPRDGAVLSRSLWESAYASSPEVVGSQIRVDGVSHTVIGIAPSSTDEIADRVGVFVFEDIGRANSNDEALRLIDEGTILARLREGVELKQAMEQVRSLETRFFESSSAHYRSTLAEGGKSVVVSSLLDERNKWIGPKLYLLNGAALLVLIIGCVNVSNLLFAQANAREHEFWIRRTIGSNIGRLVRQCCAEMALLGSLGWVASLIFSMVGMMFLSRYSNHLFDRGAEFAITARMLGYSLGLIALCAGTLGLFLAWRLVRVLATARGARLSRSATADRSSAFLRSGLLVGQIAMTLLLLIGVGLFGKSFYNVLAQDTGFDPEGVVTARIRLPETEYADDSSCDQLRQELLRRLRSISGVESATLASMVPTFGYPDRSVAIRDGAKESSEANGRAYYTFASTQYLDTLGVSLIKGRDFDSYDAFGWQDPILVEERFANRYFPDGNPLGKRVRLGGPPRNPNNWPIIVGVVENAKHSNLDSKDELPLVYMPMNASYIREFSVFIKSSLSSKVTIDRLRETVAALDATLYLFRAGSLDSFVDESLEGRRGLLYVTVALGATALLLAVLGIYGMTTYRISQRMDELAVRAAVGASRRRIVSLIVGGDLKLALLGCVIGVALAAGGSQIVASWLFGVEPVDWSVFLGVGIGLAIFSGLASYLPIRQLAYARLLAALK